MSSACPEFHQLGSYKYPFYRSKIEKLLRSCIGESFLILDAGCGPQCGYLTAIWANTEGIGLDISRTNIKGSLEISRKLELNRSSFLVGDVQKMPFRENIFNTIICQDVLEHVRDKDNAIKSMALSLKRRGRLLICTTNAFNPAVIIDDVLPRGISDAVIRILGGTPHYERHRRLNPWKLKRVLAENGLSIR